MIEVIRPGMLTTVQDLGRPGYQGLGVPVSGPMDQYSHRLANQLLGNDPAAAALEVTLLGPELLAEGDLTCAATGADITLTVNEKPAPMNEPFRVPSGARLRWMATARARGRTLALRWRCRIDTMKPSTHSNALTG